MHAYLCMRVYLCVLSAVCIIMIGRVTIGDQGLSRSHVIYEWCSRYSLYLLYWYKSTNTDAECAA